MSLLTVTGLTHVFGDRAIFNNVSFQLNRRDKIGLVKPTAKVNPHL